MNVLDILFYIFIVIVVIQIIYYTFVFSKLAFYKTNLLQSENLGISVIICAKNEAEFLKSNIPLIANQDYSKFEVILVNDCSTDSSYDVMKIYSNKYNNVHIVNVDKNETIRGNKKHALTLGIKAAQYNHLLLTDADCKPLSKHWIKHIAAHFSGAKSIVLGYGAHEKIKHSFLNKLIRFETLLTAVQYFSYALIGIPYMGVGRNLAYKKEAFFKTNGFIDHIDVLSGDDDLFINQIANKNNVAIAILPHSFTKSEPKKTLYSWFTQKKRHVSTSFKYKTKHKLFLGVFYISQFMFWLFALILLITQYRVITTLILFLLIILIKYTVLGISAKKLREKDLIAFLPILELFLICFQLSIFISNLFSKQKHWK